MSSVSVTLAIAIAVAVQVTECFVDDKVLALPLDSNLYEDVDKEAAAAQLLKVTETENVQLTQPKEKKVTGTTPTTTKLQPDCIIEVEASPEANERGHVVISIENLDPDLDVVLVVRMRRKLKLLLLLLLMLVLYHISVVHPRLIKKQLKYKRHELFREKRRIRKTLLTSVKTIYFK